MVKTYSVEWFSKPRGTYVVDTFSNMEMVPLIRKTVPLEYIYPCLEQLIVQLLKSIKHHDPTKHISPVHGDTRGRHFLPALCGHLRFRSHLGCSVLCVRERIMSGRRTQQCIYDHTWKTTYVNSLHKLNILTENYTEWPFYATFIRVLNNILLFIGYHYIIFATATLYGKDLPSSSPLLGSD